MAKLDCEEESLIYFISGMWCSTCAKTIQTKALKISQVAAAEVSYPTKLLSIRLKNHADPDEVDREIQEKIAETGFGIRRQSAGWLTSFKQDLASEQKKRISGLQVSLVWFLAMWSSMIAFVGYLGGNLTTQEYFRIALASAAFGLPAIMIGAWPYARAGLRALYSSHLLTLDLFIFLAVWPLQLLR